MLKGIHPLEWIGFISLTIATGFLIFCSPVASDKHFMLLALTPFILCLVGGTCFLFGTHIRFKKEMEESAKSSIGWVTPEEHLASILNSKEETDALIKKLKERAKKTTTLPPGGMF